MALKPEEKTTVFRRIWNGTTTLFSLPAILYNDISKNLQRGLFTGFGSTLSKLNIESPAFVLLNTLNTNIFAFSAAKTFQQVKDMQNFILNEEGFIRPFNAFRDDATKIFDQFNKQWLRTEFDTTITQAQSAQQWQDIQEDKADLPLLQYQTAGDAQVRPQHAAWDNIVRPVNDKFWDNHMPPNGFSCRCIVIQLEEGEKKVTSLTGITRNEEELFKMNPGKDKFIFDEKGVGMHPYFKVSDRFKVLKKNNFNLPLP